MKSNIVAVIVIYNKKVEDSITCKNILNNSDNSLGMLVVDNSTSDFGNKAYCSKKNIDYISMDGNKGLSKAYNAAVDVCKEKDAIILFDDDTEVTEEYFEKLDDALTIYHDVDIFAPIIYGQDGVIYSPNEYNFMRSNFIKSPNQEVSQKKFNAIASCLAIRMRVFDNYRFNEKLFVDQVDQNFFYDQRKKNAKFQKIDVKILQNFYQRGKNLTPEAGWRRLKLRIIDIMRQTRLIGGRKIRFLGFAKCCGLGAQIGKKSHSLVIPVKAFALALEYTIFDK
ncbi:MAG: glycosyltransferase [Lactobacillus sp.]|nr:glycosyltransferase [Lactobacillus sp.]